MFTELMLHGPRATLLWNYREVAVITAWRIIKAPRAWVLTARVERADAWQCQQAAPRAGVHGAARARALVLACRGSVGRRHRTPGDLGTAAAVEETHGHSIRAAEYDDADDV
jgi:hypothetical protein